MLVNEFLTRACDDTHANGVIIALKVTEPSRQPASSDVSNDAPASLLVDLDTAQRSLASQLDDLRGADTQHLHADMLTVGGAKLLQLSRLRDQLVSGAKDVTVLRVAVASAVADIRAYTSEARTATATVQGTTTEQTTSVTLLAASEAARNATNCFMDDYYKRRIFDPYLTFASAEDEEEFRRREAERKAAIEKALAEHTPEGNLRANRLSIDQLKDAGAHGASASPEYQPMLTTLEKSGETLSADLDSSKATAAKSDRQQAAAAPAAADADRDTAEAIARLRASVSIADQDGEGHGLAASKPARLTTPDVPSH